jgi:hypothetical protein
LTVLFRCLGSIGPFGPFTLPVFPGICHRMKTEFRLSGTQLAGRSSRLAVSSEVSFGTAPRQAPVIPRPTPPGMPVSPSLLVAPTAQNRLYLRFLRQAESAAWEEAMPRTSAVPAESRARRRSTSRLPRISSSDRGESWVFKLLAVVALVPAVWVCWDSADFFSRYPQFVEFVRNLVH